MNGVNGVGGWVLPNFHIDQADSAHALQSGSQHGQPQFIGELSGMLLDMLLDMLLEGRYTGGNDEYMSLPEVLANSFDQRRMPYMYRVEGATEQEYFWETVVFQFAPL